MDSGTKGLLAFILLIVMIVWAAIKLDEHSCISKWAGSGYEVRWSIDACQVQIDGRWLPDEAVKIHP